MQNEEELTQVLRQNFEVFTDLDAEFEKYFNDFESVSKLQRLMDKDEEDIIKEFDDLIQRNLRLDHNVKNSFGPEIPQRLHSF